MGCSPSKEWLWETGRGMYIIDEAWDGVLVGIPSVLGVCWVALLALGCVVTGQVHSGCFEYIKSGQRPGSYTTPSSRLVYIKELCQMAQLPTRRPFWYGASRCSARPDMRTVSDWASSWHI